MFKEHVKDNFKEMYLLTKTRIDKKSITLWTPNFRWIGHS